MQQTFFSDSKELEKLITEKRIFLIHSKSFEKMYLKELFNDKDVVEFTDFTPNPTMEQVTFAVKEFCSSGREMIVAVGGGSAIDVAKCVKLFSNLNEEEYLNRKKWVDNPILMIAVPTTAGTGSESTRHAVIYKNGIKQSISHISILPDYVLLDGKLLSGLPEYQKKSTLLDALCQSIESYWSRQANEESIEYAKKSIEIIADNWKDYIAGDESLYDKMLHAANLSGRAINITTTTAAHAMSYGITKKYRIPHGHAVALCMNAVWSNLEKRCLSADSDEYIEKLIPKLKEINSLISRDEFYDMIDDMGMLNVSLPADDGDIRFLTEGVNLERLGNHPMDLSASELEQMYKEIVGYEG